MSKVNARPIMHYKEGRALTKDQLITCLDTILRRTQLSGSHQNYPKTVWGWMFWSKMLMLTFLLCYLIDSVEMRAKIMGDRCHVHFERSPMNPKKRMSPRIRPTREWWIEPSGLITRMVFRSDRPLSSRTIPPSKFLPIIGGPRVCVGNPRYCSSDSFR